MMDIEKELAKKKLKLKIQKALTAKEELECTIMEREMEIRKIKDHLLLQDKVIKDAQDALELLVD